MVSNEPPPQDNLPPSHGGRTGRRRPGLAVIAVIGALTWIVGLWVGPHLLPPPAAAPAVAALDHDHALDPMRTVLALSAPDGALEAHLKPVMRAVTVRRGDTLMAVLLRGEVPREDAHAAVTALRKVFDPRDLMPGTELTLTFQPLTAAPDAPASFRGLEFRPSIERTVGIARNWDNRFESYSAKSRLVHEQTLGAGTIGSSLYVDAVATGVPVPVVVELIRAMSFDVDFQRDIQPQDRFEVLYDRIRDADGALVGAGDVIYASLTLSGKPLAIYRFRMDDDTFDYFNAKGESTRKALMRTPIDGARLSSRFGRRRHPILGYTRMHRGIDFAAPTGTPIMAAGRGVVTEARWNGSYGRYVRIRHNATFSTAYAHLSRLAKGVRRGARVSQGQIIGYVGTTGQSTGPHLHYEVLRNNRQVNPLALKLPTGKKLGGAELETFLAARAEIDASLGRLRRQQASAETPSPEMREIAD